PRIRAMVERSDEREGQDAPVTEAAASAAPDIPAAQTHIADIAKIIEATKFVESTAPAAGATPSAFAIVPELPKIDAPAMAPSAASATAPTQAEPKAPEVRVEPKAEARQPAPDLASASTREARRTPPPFLREHANRPIPTKQPSR